MTDDTDQTESQTLNAQDEMTEQIEASFGPMTVYVSGTDTEDVQDTFDHVWETMMDTSEKMREMKKEKDDTGGHGHAFGD